MSLVKKKTKWLNRSVQGSGTLGKLFIVQSAAEGIISTQQCIADCTFPWLLLREPLSQEEVGLLLFLKVHFKTTSNNVMKSLFQFVLHFLKNISYSVPSESSTTLNIYSHRAPCFHKFPNLIAFTHTKLNRQGKGILIGYKSLSSV